MANLIGTSADQVPTNGDLGTAAFMNTEQLPVSIAQQTALDGKQTNFVTGTNYKVPLLHATTGKFSIRNYADNDDLFTVHSTDGVTILGSLSIDNFGADATQALSTTAGNYASVSFRTEGVDRWFFGKSNAAESGANAGSNFFIGAFSDAGAFLRTDLAINRASGEVDIPNLKVSGTTKTLNAPAAAAAFTVDLTKAVNHHLTNANTIITLPTVAVGKQFELHIAFGGAHTVTWAGGTADFGGTAYAPTSAAGKTDVLIGRANAAGTRWLIATHGKNYTT